MQERTALEDQLTSIGRIEPGARRPAHHDRARRGREGSGGDRRGRERAAQAQGRRGAARARGAAVGRGGFERQLPGSPCRRRRHREPGLGQHAAAHVHALGREARPQGRVPGRDRGRGSRHQVGDHPGQGPQRLWLAQDRDGRAPAGAHLALRLQRAAPHLVRQRRRLSGDRRQHQDRYPGVRRPRRPHARERGRGPARQQDRVGDPPDPHPDQHLRVLPERPLAAPQPARRPGRCCARGSTRSS